MGRKAFELAVPGFPSYGERTRPPDEFFYQERLAAIKRRESVFLGRGFDALAGTILCHSGVIPLTHVSLGK